jgi:hypothetical protein
MSWLGISRGDPQAGGKVAGMTKVRGKERGVFLGRLHGHGTGMEGGTLLEPFRRTGSSEFGQKRGGLEFTEEMGVFDHEVARRRSLECGARNGGRRGRGEVLEF